MKAPTGMHGRRTGWEDKNSEWESYDASQKQAAADMSATAIRLRGQADSLGVGATTAKGYSAAQLISMADNLDASIIALNDDGSLGFFVHAVNAAEIHPNFAQAEIGGKSVYFATDHPDYGGNRMNFFVGHEALHNAGLRDQKMGGDYAYRFGRTDFQRRSFKNLPHHRRHINPDHIMSEVYR